LAWSSVHAIKTSCDHALLILLPLFLLGFVVAHNQFLNCNLLKELFKAVVEFLLSVDKMKKVLVIL